MAELEPTWMQGACTTAQDDRLVISSLICGEGVADLSSGALLVSPGAGALTTSVASGGAFIEGDSVGSQGVYHVYNDSDVVLTHAPGDGVNPRIDLVVARVRDSQYSGANDDWVLEVIQGTASAVPAVPSLPPSSIALAEVLIGSGASGVIPGGNVTDVRTSYTFCLPNIPNPTWMPQTRRTDVTMTSQSQKDETISFPVPFAAIPEVVVCPGSAHDIIVAVQSRNNSDFSVRIRTRDGSNLTANVRVAWIAMIPPT